MSEEDIPSAILRAVETHDLDDEPGSPIGHVVQEVLDGSNRHFSDVADEFRELFFHGVLYQPSTTTVATTWIEADTDDSGESVESTEKLPWCPDCDVFAVPDDDGDCGECGTAVVYREVEV